WADYAGGLVAPAAVHGAEAASAAALSPAAVSSVAPARRAPAFDPALRAAFDPALRAAFDPALRAAIDAASAALAAGDLARLAAQIPSGEHWRLFGELGAGAAYLDIETSDDVVGHEGISAIGVLDRGGPRLFLAERDLEQFPEAARGWSMLVTFNVRSYDVPILRR